jgi:hypothetical protein
MLCVVVVLPACPALARFCACIRVMRWLARFGSRSTGSTGAMLPESARLRARRFEPVLNELSLLT